MQIIEWDDFLKNGLACCGDYKEDKTCAMTIGVFDGVHKGHRALIKRIVSQNAVPVAVTFREPAYKYENIPFIIQSFDERAATLKTLGVAALIVIDFTEEFSRITGIEFLETLLTRAKIGFFAVGANFRCGCGLDTDAKKIYDFFMDKGILAEIVPEVHYDGSPVSSSRIREALAEGNLELAESMLKE